MNANVTKLIEDLKIISTGPRGLMCEILETVQNDGPDAKTLGGKRAAEYASTSQLEEEMRKLSVMIARDDEPSLTSEDLLMTKGIMKITGAISDYP